MAQYTPPLRDMQFVLHELFNVVEELKAMPPHAEIDADTINAVLEEGGKFASQVTAPLNQSGDEEGCKLDQTTHEVTTPQGFKPAFRQYADGGWMGISAPVEFGGQGLPGTLTLLSDARYDDEEALRWLFTDDESLPGSPVQALSTNRGTEANSRASASRNPSNAFARNASTPAGFTTAAS